ncbi:MAG: DUF5690 family protein [Puia sp.]
MLPSKFYGIRLISELKKIGRGKIILLLVGISWARIVFICPGSRPLEYPVHVHSTDFHWGSSGVLSFRMSKADEPLILSVQSAFRQFYFFFRFRKNRCGYIYNRALARTNSWLPFVTGLVFSMPLLICVYFLEKIPAPSVDDIKVRSVRAAHDVKAKKRIYTYVFYPGLIACIGIYVFATVFRDIRDNFMADMLKENGYGLQPAPIYKTEVPVTLILLVPDGQHDPG